MQPISSQLEKPFRAAIRAAFDMDADPLIAPSQNDKFGDYQSNAAMGLAKQIAERTGQKTNPRAVAEQVKGKLDLGEMAEDTSIAGPGFINVRLSPKWLARQLEEIARDATRLGVDSSLEPEKVVVDYSGPNIAKQMHIGHLRPTNIGDAIARILEFHGQQVIRQNHLGDWGTQFGMLLAYLKSNGGAASAEISDLNEFYKKARQRFDSEPEFADEARKTVVQLQAGHGEEKALWTTIVDQSRAHFQPLYDRMSISLRPEHERGESFYNPMLGDVVRELREKKVAVESDGAIVVWVKGFESPLIVQKSDGGYGYGTTDLAAVRYRVRELGARRLIYLTDSRQIQHFAQVFATAQMAGWTEGVQLDHAWFGTILGEDGKPMKARSGEPQGLKEVFDEGEARAFAAVSEKSPHLPEAQRWKIAHAVGVGAIKYFDLNKDRVGDYIFDWAKMLSLDGNTAPYLQYAYARIRSIFRKAGMDQAAVSALAADGGLRLDAPAELAFGKHMLRLGEVIAVVSRELKPHHLCTYLYELATRFSSFYESCNVLQSDEPTRASRLLLCDLTARTLALGLDLLGIGHPDEM